MLLKKLTFCSVMSIFNIRAKLSIKPPKKGMRIMSDEKESKTINISPLPSCVDDTVKEALKPAAKGIGTLLGDLLSMATNSIHFRAEKARIQQEHDLEVFKAGLTK